MNKIITISGNAGSGKSTIAKKLIDILEAKRIYVGGIRRELAREKGMTLYELNQYAMNNPETDVEVDKKAAEEARELVKQSTVIVEGRTQFHFLPESVKILIKVSLDVGAKRIWKDLQDSEINEQRNEAELSSFEDFKEKTQERQNSDLQRYKKYYNLNHMELVFLTILGNLGLNQILRRLHKLLQ